MTNYERLQNGMLIIYCKDCKYRGSDIECPMCYTEDYYDDDLGYDYIFHDRTLDDSFCDRGELDEESIRHEEYVDFLTSLQEKNNG